MLALELHPLDIEKYALFYYSKATLIAVPD